MNRNLLIGFVGGLAFVASLLGGLWLTDFLTDNGGGEPRLPGAIGAPIELMSPVRLPDTETPSASDLLPEPTNAVLVPIDASAGRSSGSDTGESAGTGSGAAPATGGSDTTTTTSGDDGDPPLAIIDDPRLSGLFTGDLFLGLWEFPPFRFIDLCADSPLPSCPPGVGGTILAPFGGGFDVLGDFRLGDNLGNAAELATACEGDSGAGLEPTDHPVFVWASHPASFEVTYYPSTGDFDRTTIAFSNTDPDDPEFLRFAEDATEDRLATSPWPRDCFVLTEFPGFGSTYIIEVSATSFTGETASKTYRFNVPSGARFPVIFEPLNDHDIRVSIPIKSATQRAWVTAIRAQDELTCGELEEATGPFNQVYNALGGVLGHGTTPIPWGFVPIPSDRFDRSYDVVAVYDILRLLEGQSYRVCIWWTESAERSFDSAPIVERETRWITVPNGSEVLISPRQVQNTTGATLAAGSYRLIGSCGPDDQIATLPTRDLDEGATVAIPMEERPILCNYGGRPIPALTQIWVEAPAYERRISIPLDPSGGHRTEQVTIDLSAGESDAVAAGGSGRGPTVVFNVVYSEGADGASEEWGFGTPEVFEPFAEPPRGLPYFLRLDDFNTWVQPAGPNAIEVNIAFDRPVRLSASLLGDDLCLTGFEPAYSTSIFSDTHIFRLDGLCLFTRYSVLVEVEDELGNTYSYSETTLPPYHPSENANLSGWTAGNQVSFAVWNTAARTGRSEYVSTFDVTVGSERFDLIPPSQCFLPNQPLTPGLTTRGATAEWGPTVTVRVRLVIDNSNRGEGGECEGSGSSVRTADVETVFSISDYTIGDGFAITVPLPLTNRRGEADRTESILIVGRIAG